ncbi:hypothetical protein [Roseisolibacter agri]|uniref:Uncharacterized protein n=1 Tax=Roseisolibacter agri TaxID=2014610 RepID=A0AA37V2Z7_9BACT|nr:hypothetical protein [Roseisolibacter agri]GLC25887.1 hypothetical protein rosag_24000 [Roseisolibacter agri]
MGIRRRDQEDHILRLIQQAGEVLRRLRERLTHAAESPEAVRQEAASATDALLGGEAPLLRRLDARSAARLVGHAGQLRAWAELLDVQADAARAALDVEAAGALGARAKALREAVAELWPDETAPG